jgi:hypothetical protein
MGEAKRRMALSKSNTSTNITIFNSEVNDFCRKHLVGDVPIAPAERLFLAKKWVTLEASLFEQLLLFDHVALKVYGENVPVATLLTMLGENAFDALIEQKALRFVLWTPNVVYMKTEIKGLNPLVFGNLNSGPYSDPEQSVKMGLKWTKIPLTDRAKRRLVRKLTPLYVLPDNEFAGKAVNVVHSAYDSGKFEPYGLSPKKRGIMELPEPERQLLCECATELLDYYFFIDKKYSSYSNPKYFHLFSTSVEKFRTLNQASKAFAEIAEVENFPDLKSLYAQGERAMAKVPKLRQQRSSVRFRSWLASMDNLEDGRALTTEYIDAIANAKGPFETTKGKFTKSIAMASIGAGIGAAISGSLEGATWGAAAGKVLEPAADLGLDLLDAFLLGKVTKGWTPRMFFDDLKRISKKN